MNSFFNKFEVKEEKINDKKNIFNEKIQRKNVKR
jgi:hypothetical protein